MPPQQPQQVDPDRLPIDLVVMTVWTVDKENPIQATVTRESWATLCEIIAHEGGLDPNFTYEFDGPTSAGGRKGKFFMRGVTKVAANYHSGIVPAKVG